MSRSRRKTPKCGNTKARSEKHDKALSNRKMRAMAAQSAKNQDEDEATPPEKSREAVNTWQMDKDGKQWFDPKKFPELMRK